MEEENIMIDFDQPKEQSSYIKVIGVGGGGGNAVNYMFEQGINGVDFIVCNTDLKALNMSPVANKITLGKKGLGAGNKPERAKAAAENQADEIREMLSHNTQMLFITAGMGGGTGTGAAPVIAEIAKSIDLDDEDTKKILVVAIVTTPLTYEGPQRKIQAEAGIAELRKHVDSILVINNDKLRNTYGNLTLSGAFAKANTVLHTAAKGIAEIITGNGIVNIDFQDVNTVMEKSGTALMGTGCGKGEKRAIEAIKNATDSPLLNDNNIAGAKNMLIYYSYSPEHEITMDEMTEITDYLKNITADYKTDIIWGAGCDDSLDDELKITLIATGFEQQDKKSSNISQVKEEPKVIPIVEGEGARPMTTSGLGPELEPHRDEPKPTDERGNTEGNHQGHNYILDDTTQDTPSDSHNLEKQQNTQKGESNITESTNIPKDLEPTIVTPEPVATAPIAQDHHLPGYTHGVPATQISENVVDPQQNPFEPRRKDTSVFGSQQPESSDENFIKNAILDRAERIRKMNEMLKNKPDGPQLIESLTTEELTNEVIYETPRSNISDVTNTIIGVSGVITSANNFLFDNPD